MDSIKTSWETLTAEEREKRYSAFGAKPKEADTEKNDFDLLKHIEEGQKHDNH